MPYKRQSKRAPRKRRTTKQLVSQEVKKQINKASETKTRAFSSQSASPDTSGVDILSVNYLAEGTDQTNRIGERVTFKKFYYKGTLEDQSTGPTRTRFTLYRPRDDNDSRLAGVLSVDSEIDLDAYIVYKDFIVLTDGNTGAVRSKNINITWTGNRKFHYSGAAASDLVTTPICLHVVSNRSVISTPPLFQYRARSYFKDM